MDSELKLLRYEDLIRITGLSRSTISRYCKAGKMPRPIEFGSRVPLWREKQLIDWLNSLDKDDWQREKADLNKRNTSSP